MILRWLAWLNRSGKQTAIRAILWRWRVSEAERVRLKRELREARRR